MYDLCTRIKGIKSNDNHHSLFPHATKNTRGDVIRGTYGFENEKFSVQAAFSKGEYGRMYTGTFGKRTVAIKMNLKVPVQDDINEVRLQTELYCYVKEHGHLGRHIARIPEPVFAAFIPGFGRVLGMERVDSTMIDLVLTLRKDARIRWLRDALLKLCALLAILQEKFSFMHGDLHGDNVMVRGSDVFLIDLGMSSARVAGARVVADRRYVKIPFHSQLDLLTLLTALRDDFASSSTEVAGWCGAFVDPFWNTVQRALQGDTQTVSSYGAQSTVRAARKELSDKGEIYYAHHLLYDNIGHVSYQTCEPQHLMRLLKASKLHGTKVRGRIFER